MTDAEPAPSIPPPPAAIGEDKTLPAAVYILHLVGLFSGLPILIGLILAYANLGTAGPVMRSHYIFQIRSVWLALAWWLIGVALICVGVPLSFVLVGIPLLMLGVLIFCAGHLWFAIRAVLGLISLSNGEAYPRPQTWFV